jgi:hypothetical protein
MPVFIYVHHNDVWGTGGKVYALSGSAQVEGTQSTDTPATVWAHTDGGTL